MEDRKISLNELFAVKLSNNKVNQAYCGWKRTDLDDEDEPWDTDCGLAFILIEGSPKENDYNFCPNCGRRIKEGLNELQQMYYYR